MTTAPRTSAISRAILGPDAEWGLTDHLLALVIDALQAANWQRSGGKGAKPKPMKRPGASRGASVQMDNFESPEAFEQWWASH